jgi:hypothetical protein
MKLILSQIFKISLKYSTIVSYAGIISVFKFFLVNKVKNTPLNFFKNQLQNYQQWGLIGSMMMTGFLAAIYLILCFNPFATEGPLVLTVTILSSLLILGETIADTAINIFYAHTTFDKKSLSSSLFMGHKIAALLGYFLFPMMVDYIGFHSTFITFLLLSFMLNLTIFYLPPVQFQTTKESTSVVGNILEDLKKIPNIIAVMIFIITCQGGTLVIAGMKCNFIAQITKKKFLSYMLRGLGLLVGIIGGTQTTGFIKRNFNKEDSNEKTFIIGALLHTISIIINFIAFQAQTSLWFIVATIFENLNKGFMMAALTKFFLVESHQKPHLLTFFWGFFSLLRSFYGGISGYLVTTMGVNYLFYLLIFSSLLPIFIPFFIKSSK